jgi:peptide/nickel transport system substrate-binding protein
MMIGTDQKAIAKALYLEADIHTHPIDRTAGELVYTPIEKMPKSTAMLFDYNPEQAKQMLADAGYPDGFSIEMVYRSDPEDEDIASMLVAQWEKIGVDVALIPLDRAAHNGIRSSHDYKHTFLWDTGSGSPSQVDIGLWVEGRTTYNVAEWNEDPTYSERILDIEDELDFSKKAAVIKQLCLDIVDAAPNLAIAHPHKNCYVWPWVKNYYGEISASFVNFAPMFNRLWIDTDMKEEMGY